MAITANRRAAIFGLPGSVDKVKYRTPWGITVSIHPLILEVFTAACEEAHRTCKWVPQRIDHYNNRPIRGEDGSDLDEWSLHAWALAFDFFATPPNVPPPGGVWTPDNAVPADFAACFTRRGFRWGATFGRKDIPHIEWADGLPGPVEPAPPPQEDDMPLTAEERQVLDDIAHAVVPVHEIQDTRYQVRTIITEQLNALVVPYLASLTAAVANAGAVNPVDVESLAGRVADELAARLKD